jgi:outer membrane scaffolding protein for murein synthesis (MipA/OmpV family)
VRYDILYTGNHARRHAASHRIDAVTLTSTSPSVATGAITVATLVAATIVVATPASATGDLVPAGTTIAVGAQAIVQPTYEGSGEYELVAVPIVKFGGSESALSFVKFDFRALNDVGIGVVNVGGLSFGPAVGYRFDREEDDGDRLRNLGDIDGGFLVGGFARYDLKPFYVRGSYLTQVSGEEDAGGIFRFQGGADFHVSPQLLLKTFAAVEWADDDYMQTYFGVTAAQSAASGLTRFDPSSGAKSFHLGATAEYEVFPTWTVHAGVEYVQLLGDAADSPITEDESQVVARLGLSKSFTIGR